jgi:hypothetical protein
MSPMSTQISIWDTFQTSFSNRRRYGGAPGPVVCARGSNIYDFGFAISAPFQWLIRGVILNSTIRTSVRREFNVNEGLNANLGLTGPSP